MAPRATTLRAAQRTLRERFATALVVPAVVLVAGSHWSCPQREVTPRTAELWIGDAPGAPRRAREVDLSPLAEGLPLYRGTSLAKGQLEVTLPRPLRRFSVELQAEPDHSFRVGASSDGEPFAPLWEAPVRRGRGALTRSSPLLEPPQAVSALRIAPLAGDGRFLVTGLRVRVPPARVAHAWLLPAIWGALAAALAARRHPRLAPFGERALRAWARLDLPVAAALIFGVCFRVTPELALAAGLLLAIAAALACLKRFPGPTLAVGATAALLIALLPAALTRVVLSRIAETHELTVDHRMRPDPARGINSDGLRERREANAFAERDYVVLMLGDSFTYGEFLAAEQTYPSQLERLAAGYACDAPVRAVNAGWTSASPLLALRLLREIGPAYRPDLVVYNLDMSDFHDDLYYEAMLEREGDLGVDPARILDQLAQRHLGWLDVDLAAPTAFRSLLRRGADGGSELRARADRFFATNQPLDDSRAHIERGVRKNLADLHAFAAQALGARTALVLHPRSFQYSARESPRNWERRAYPVLGPFVKEPFRYFREVEAELPYPVVDLLPAFERTGEFPLFRDDDPHWTPAGARFVAREVAEALLERGLLPCESS